MNSLAQSPEELLSRLKSLGDDVPAENIDELQTLLQSLQNPQAEEQSSDAQEVTPSPGFVVKTENEDGRKFFINICSADEVAAPGGWEGGQMPEEARKALENVDAVDQSNAELLRFPLSMSEVRNDLDRRGQACSVIDCIFNTAVLQQASQLRSLKHFIVELTINWVANKHKMTLDPKYKLPKLKYKGDRVMAQHIRATKKSLVTELPDALDEPQLALRAVKLIKPATTSKSQHHPASAADKSQTPLTAGAASQPLATITNSAAQRGSDAECCSANSEDVEAWGWTTQFEGVPVERTVVAINTRAVDSNDSHAADGPPCAVLQGHQLRVFDGRQRCRCTIDLVFAANASDTSTELDEDGVLTVTLPFQSATSYVEALRAAQPHMHGSLQLADTSYLELEP